MSNIFAHSLHKTPVYVQNFFLQIKDKLDADDMKKAMDKCTETLAWLETNQMAEKDEFEHHQKELEGICNPIMTKLYASAGSGGQGGMPGGMGGMPGGMPGRMPEGGGGGAGPTIEEVD